MKCKLKNFNSLIATFFYSCFVRKIYFTAKILIIHIIPTGLICISAYAEAHLEHSRISAVELLWENYK